MNGSQNVNQNSGSSVLQPSYGNPSASQSTVKTSSSLPPRTLFPAVPTQPTPATYYPFISNPLKKDFSGKIGKGKEVEKNISKEQKGKEKGEGKGSNSRNAKGEGKGKETDLS